MLSQNDRHVCRLFADVLDYPGKDLARISDQCSVELAGAYPAIAGPLRSFADYVRSQSLESMEELYTQTFDITPATSLYMGFHLFGETPKRSEFLVRLTEAYQACSFSTGTELADHLGIMLRFLSVSQEPDFALPLLKECMMPTLAMTEKELKKIDNPYSLVLESLHGFLNIQSRNLSKAGGGFNA